MAGGWKIEGSRNGVVSLLSLPEMHKVMLDALEGIAKDAAASAGDGFEVGKWTGFRKDLPAGFRWDLQKVSGRVGYVGGVIGSGPTPRERKAARKALAVARLGKGGA